MHRLGPEAKAVVCASAGNFGQGIAFACRKRNIPITVFAAKTANPLKIDRMRALGAQVELAGDDFDQAKDAAKRHSIDHGALYVEDGKLGAIAEGAVCAEAAPSMFISWRERRPVEAPSTTIADGIGVRVPVSEAVESMASTVDEVVLVSDEEMRTWMRRLFKDAGIVIEPAGAAGLAAIGRASHEWEESRVATILTGGNLTEQQLRDWLY